MAGAWGKLLERRFWEQYSNFLAPVIWRSTLWICNIERPCTLNRRRSPGWHVVHLKYLKDTKICALRRCWLKPFSDSVITGKLKIGSAVVFAFEFVSRPVPHPKSLSMSLHPSFFFNWNQLRVSEPIFQSVLLQDRNFSQGFSCLQNLGHDGFLAGGLAPMASKQALPLSKQHCILSSMLHFF